MPLNGHRILVVEDEPLIAFDLMSIIRKARGDVAAHAASLTRALVLADTPRLSLAILDFRLGSETSLPVAAKLYAHGVPFIFHTGTRAPILSETWPQVLGRFEAGSSGSIDQHPALARDCAFRWRR